MSPTNASGKQLTLAPNTQNTETALAAPTDVWSALEKVAQEASLATLEGQGRFQKMASLAEGITRLREMITPEIMAPVMALQGTPLGFRTDKDGKGGYSMPDVKEALIEAVLRGVYPVGNEFNIIAGRAYITREGMSRLVSEWPCLAKLEIDLGVPTMKDGGAIVPCTAAWRLNGLPMTLTATIPVKVNAGMGADAILGKATRKILKRVHDRLTGSKAGIPDGDVEFIDVEPGKALPATAGEKMGFPGKD